LCVCVCIKSSTKVVILLAMTFFFVANSIWGKL
jgi:hypothetical protein